MMATTPTTQPRQGYRTPFIPLKPDAEHPEPELPKLVLTGYARQWLARELAQRIQTKREAEKEATFGS